MGGMLTSAIIPRFSCCSFEISQGLAKYSTLCLKRGQKIVQLHTCSFRKQQKVGQVRSSQLRLPIDRRLRALAHRVQFPHSWAAGRRRPAESDTARVLQGPYLRVASTFRHNSVAERLERYHVQKSKACRDTPVSSHVGQEHASIDLCHIASPVLLYQAFA